ncbi:ABC transporter ATP-binding protein [Allomuricauda sp. SCSIO 65647]|uniref:ABC transporter ATP-binding protein n=1 Tax=Allomuricauda sp. SCSIO 65647 TaxID=2908843 RepID=UPI001F41A1CF|nr:ABC transporter ATP-binding protein [Muricauda sp. SCSIO 65647]UJH67677.1 ABC transporter ATP-binding protein [Muricauda sp. SCSIO 65647]
MEEEKKSIAVSDLSIGYKDLVLINELSFQLNKGEFCAIVGVNGIGKSTLLRTLAKLQVKLQGDILVQEKLMGKLSQSALAKKISVVLTEPIASKNLTVQELIALGRQPYTNWLGTLTEHDREIILRSLKTFGLENIQHKKCHELSDGQQQRVFIARAMAQDTSLILLDEPTTHLDLHHKVQIFKLLQQLAHGHDKTILFTTHEIALAIQLCDKMLILDGKENPFGEPCQLIEQGHFERLFPKEMVRFDARTGSFKVTE